MLRQLQHRAAEGLAHAALGRDEVGRARGVADVLVGRVGAVRVVGVEQALGRLALHHEREFPYQVVGVLDARVGTARAEGRDLVRRITHEQQAAVAEVRHAPALEGVDAGPLKFKLAVVAEHGLDARQDVLGLLLFLRVGIPAELKVDAPDIVGLLVQQHRLVGVEGRIEPEPALGREIGLHDDVGDQETVLEHLALDVEPELAAHRAARTVGHDEPVGLDVEAPVRGLHRDGGVVGVRLHTHDLVLPADVHAQFHRPRHQGFFQVVLLQVDHARALVAGFGHEVEAVDLILLQEGAAHVPAHAFFTGEVAHAQAVEHLQRALGIAHRPRPHRDAVVLVEHQHRQVVQPGVDGRTQPHGAGADHDQRASLGAICPLEVGRRPIGEFRVGVGRHGRGSPAVGTTGTGPSARAHGETIPESFL